MKTRFGMERVGNDVMKICDLVNWYLKDKLRVNRRYQRKLVWTVKEKQLLIDSLFEEIPLPNFFFTMYDDLDENGDVINSNVKDIIDGLQRIDAIIEFIFNKYKVMYKGQMCYFNYAAMPGTWSLLRDHIVQQKEPVLDLEVCEDFVNIELTESLVKNDPILIDKIFNRINSTGRRVSSHDFRQAMATGEFANTVRRIASLVRNDFTQEEIINLKDIQKISVGPADAGFGIDCDTIFWRRHDLVTQTNIRESKDEEIIETILAIYLLQGDFIRTKKSLDDLYNPSTDKYTNIENKLAQYDKRVLEKEFVQTFDVIDDIFNPADSNFSELFDKKKTTNKDNCFIAVFLSIHKLIKSGYKLLDAGMALNALRNAKAILYSVVDSKSFEQELINTTVDNLYNLLKPSFNLVIPGAISELEKEIDKRLSYSKIERAMTEYKIGVCDFETPQLNRKCIEKICKTLIAMSNTYSREDGLVIVGIADTEEAFKDWYRVYGTSAVSINQHLVPGIIPEATRVSGKLDTYFQDVKSLIKTLPMSSRYKDHILRTTELITYHGTELLVFHALKYNPKMEYNYDYKVYKRIGDSTKEMKNLKVKGA